jgi:hypothetical protein
VSALGNHAALAGHDDEGAANGTACLLASRRPMRCDTLIASTLLVVLIAGWVMNFVSIRQLTLGLGSLMSHATAQHRLPTTDQPGSIRDVLDSQSAGKSLWRSWSG